MWLGGRWWSKPALAVGILLAAGAFTVGAWWFDARAHEGEPFRNVSLGAQLIGGLDRALLEDRLAAVAEQVGSSTVVVDLGDERLEFLARDLGIGVETAATLEAALAVGRTGSTWDQVRTWALTLDNRRPVDVQFTFDEAVARSTLRDHPLTLDRPPVHPSATFDGEVLVPVEGAPGRGIDIDSIVAAVARGVLDREFAEVEGLWLEIPSPIPFGEAQSVVAGITDRVGAGIVVRLGETLRWVPPKPLYSWMSSTTDSGSLEIVFDGQEALQYVEALFADVWRGDIDPKFELVDGEPVFADLGDSRAVCCSAQVVPMLEAVVLGEAQQPVDVPLRGPTEDESLLVARRLGVSELVSEFTTEHACCASRVQNIHRIADIIRGYVIAPGQQLSINNYVGRRTRDNGFVSAGVIQSGRFDDAVGGGISQFATTIFNAAFFAGLDIPEYQSHSIYISRYPYGREATLSYPAPDLVIDNTTPHHVLIWTSYTDTSITVQMYSTPYAVVTEAGQSVGRLGACTRVETFRHRTYPDGSVVEDSVIATYRPGEGLDCRGRPTPQP